MTEHGQRAEPPSVSTETEGGDYEYDIDTVKMVTGITCTRGTCRWRRELDVSHGPDANEVGTWVRVSTAVHELRHHPTPQRLMRLDEDLA